MEKKTEKLEPNWGVKPEIKLELSPMEEDSKSFFHFVKLNGEDIGVLIRDESPPIPSENWRFAPGLRSPVNVPLYAESPVYFQENFLNLLQGKSRGVYL